MVFWSNNWSKYAIFPYKGQEWSIFFKNKDQNCIFPEVRDNSSRMMYRGPWGTPGGLGGGGGRMGLQDGPIGLGAQKALISMAIINILGRDTDFSKIVAGALCLGMPMGADCTLTTLRYSILRATNPQMPVNRVFCAPRRTVRGTQNRGVAP